MPTNLLFSTITLWCTKRVTNKPLAVSAIVHTQCSHCTPPEADLQIGGL